MHQVILFSLFVCVLGVNKDNYEKCKLVIENQTQDPDHCCNDFPTKISQERFRDFMDKSEECFNIADSETKCERETCIAKQMGFLSESGEINIELIERIVSDINIFGQDNEILDLVRQKCFNVPNHDAYGAEGDCELKKIYNCINSQISFQCKHWKTSDTCVEFQKVAEECVNLY